MKKYRYQYDTQKYPNLTINSKTLFLDIETTGFQRTSTYLTIIGLAWLEGNQLIIEQWLNESGHSEEPLLLIELEHFLKNFQTEQNCQPELIHYNGTTFDLPYLKSKYEQYHLPTSLPECDSLDLFHLAKKYRSFLSLDGIRQKNLEECFGLFREDKLSGQNLIDVYLEGMKQGNKQLLDAYLLHNKEDMEGMVFLIHLLRLHQLFEGSFEIQEWIENEETHSVLIGLSGNFILYQPVNITMKDIQFTFEKSSLWIRLPILSMEARFFYDNYKDYYYLPAEDTAIHKSVAEYVEKEYRIKATRKTCYTKKTASFLPLPLPDSSHLRNTFIKGCTKLDLFYQCYGGCTAYILKDTSCEKKKIYLKQLLQTLLMHL